MFSVKELQSRRKKLADRLPDDSLVLLFANKPIIRNGDAEYPFRQQSDFYYITGLNEPDAIFYLQKQAGQLQTALFTKGNNPETMKWVGRYLEPEEVQQQTGVDQVFPLARAEAELANLLAKHQCYFLPKANAALFIEHKLPFNKNSQLLAIDDHIASLRLCKSSEEVARMQQAIDISIAGHKAVMQAAQPGMNEYQLEAIFAHKFKQRGARYFAYEPIIASGASGLCLHYCDNNQVLKAGDLVLMDVGAEQDLYGADLTRTFPVSGRFSEPQRELYQLVLDAHQAVINIIKPGLPRAKLQQTAVEVFTKGLLALGFIKNQAEVQKFYYHGVSHWLGLDTHDAGAYIINGESVALQPGMILTVEPGLYIWPDPQVPTSYHHIAIRIEDNVLVTDTGCKVLSKALPISVEDIEACCQLRILG